MESPDPRLAELLHRELIWNTPLSAEHADRLLRHLDLPPGGRLLDLGCGWGELLLRAIARTPGSNGEGVETNRMELERGRDEANRRGLSGRVTFQERDASGFSGIYDRIICIGASHAWGGSTAALEAIEQLLNAGGRVLYGDGFWAKSRHRDSWPCSAIWNTRSPPSWTEP
jgi:cyclopropane fatty-acyl-phospholipid synthase-like methyltransferase